MGDFYLKMSLVSKRQILLALTLSAILSAGISYAIHQSKDRYYSFGATIIVPDKYINDNFYEIARIHKSHETIVDYTQFDHDKMSRIIKFDIRKAFGESHVNVYGGDGVITITGRDADREKAKILATKGVTLVFNAWKKHFENMKAPLIAFRDEVNSTLNTVSAAIETNKKLLELKQNDNIIKTLALEKQISLQRIKAEFTGKKVLIDRILANIREPFISKENSYLGEIKPSLMKALTTAALCFIVISGIIINILYLRGRYSSKGIIPDPQ